MLAKTLDTPDSTVSLETDLEHVANSVENLQEMLAKATEYVNKVIDGSEPTNEANGRYGNFRHYLRPHHTHFSALCHLHERRVCTLLVRMLIFFG